MGVTDLPASDISPCGFFKNKSDFVEVKHGEWIENDYRTFDGFETVVHPNEALKCSNCNHNFKKELLWCKNYCPECGADMRKGENNAK
jgi:Zn finger protein HypA/HybF involved in hydrogenase expression